MGTDFLLLPNAFTQVTLEIMSKMAGRHQLYNYPVCPQRGREIFLVTSSYGNWDQLQHDVPFTPEILPHLLLLLKITIKLLANVYTVKTCSSECEVAHVHHQIQIRHQYKTQTKSWKYRENKEYYCIVSMYSCKWCLIQISSPKAISRKKSFLDVIPSDGI